MRQIASRLILLSILIVCVPVGASELLMNGSFERSSDGARMSNGWEDNSGWADVDVDYKRKYDTERGGYTQLVTSSNFRHGAVQFVQPGFSVRKGRAYRVSFWARGDINSPLEVLFRKRGSPYTIYYSKGFRIYSDWRQYSFIATVEHDDDSAYFMFRFTSAGSVELDDVIVTYAAKQRNDNTANKVNYVSNGSFEVGTEAWGIKIRSKAYEDELPVSWMGLSARRDDKYSVAGLYSLKVPGTGNTRFIVTSENMQLQPDASYKLSLWLRSDKDKYVSVGLGSGYFRADRSWLKQVKVGSEWKRYVLTVHTQFSDDNLYFINVEGEGGVWIDAVQLSEHVGNEYKAGAAVEVGFEKTIKPPIFTVGDDISMPLHVVSNSPANDCWITVTSESYYNDSVVLARRECSKMRGGENKTFLIKHSSAKPGYYRLTAKVEIDEGTVDIAEYAIGVVHKQPLLTDADRASSPFGGHATFSENNLSVLRKVGVRWLRMHPPLATKWPIFEKRRGQYRYYDDILMRVRNMGFELLGSLDRTPHWASEASVGDDRYWAYPPVDLDAWEEYVFKIVRHYKGVVNYWEVWNEPDSNGFLKVYGINSYSRRASLYVELLKRAYIAAKRANPDAIIVGGVATGHPPSKWLSAIIDNGALEYLDVLSFHYYTDGRPGDVLDRPLGREIDYINEIVIEKGGKSVPIWESESGILFSETSYIYLHEVTPGFSVPGDEAVAYVIRHYVHLLSSGVEKWFYYAMTTSNRIDRREGGGFFEWDGAPKPLAVAYSFLSSLLSGTKYMGSEQLGDQVRSFVFSGKRHDIRVVMSAIWGAGLFRATFERGNNYSDVRVYDAMGRQIDNDILAESIDLAVGREPLYIVTKRR